MVYLKFELRKIFYRRFSLGLLAATVLLFPATVGAISYLNAVKDMVAAEQFARNVAYGILAYSQFYFFVPVWIIVFPGLELSQGHVNRVVFIRSRQFYFISKIWYCGIISTFYTLLGLATLVCVLSISSLDISANSTFYVQFFAQMAVSTFAFSILLLCIVFLVKSTVGSFVVLFGLSFVEGIAFILVKHWYDVELRFLPLHLVRSFYLRNGEGGTESFYFPLVSDWMILLVPISLLLLTLIIVYRYFSRSDLVVLSD